jgi:hypothetical protein
MVSASLVWVSSLSIGNAALAAGAPPKVTVSPSVIYPTDQYFQTTRRFAGTGAVVTVTVGPNSVLQPGWPVEVQECDANPTSGDDCDTTTTLAFDQLTKIQVLAAANGSVTVHFLVWSPLPNSWDKYSVIQVGPGHPTSLWIGDDPSRWAATGLVSSPVVVGSKRAARSGGPVLHTQSGKTSPGTALGETVGIGLAALAVLIGSGVTIGWRRRQAVR